MVNDNKSKKSGRGGGKTAVSKKTHTVKKTLKKKPATVVSSMVFKKKTIPRRREVHDIRHPEFQPIIDAFGSENILENFALFLGRDNINTIISGYEDDNGNIASRIRIATGEIPKNFSGVVFDGAHWKGYESKRANVPRVVYDSYMTGLQIEKTMNFCQSYATFLWAQEGNLHFNKHGLNITFQPGKYVENVKKMATLWLAWFDYVDTLEGGKVWLSQAIPISHTFPHGSAGIKKTLRELKTNTAKADEFSKATL